jgi:hypothetical protein
MSIKLQQLSDALGFKTTTDLDTRYTTTQILDLFYTDDIEDYLDSDNNLSSFSDEQIEDEARDRGLLFDDVESDIIKVVQSHRMGLLKIEGRDDDVLLKAIYTIANKVV